MNTLDLVMTLREMNRAGRTHTAEYKRLRADLSARNVDEVHNALDASDVMFGTVPQSRQ
jgi:hypothetical protein